MGSDTDRLHFDDAIKDEFRDQGYLVLSRVIPDEHLQILRSGCQYSIDMVNAEMDREKVDVKGPNHRGKRYFISLRYKQIPRVEEFIFSDLMSSICLNLLGNTAYLFYEQFVVKGAKVGMKFNWHQDSAYVLNAGYPPHPPFLTCWCALDDVTESNGTVYILQNGSREVVDHIQDSETSDLVGYHGNDPGRPVIAPAGSIAVFSSTTFHRSGPNTTHEMRRTYVAQYSSVPISNETGLMAFAEPLLLEGKRVSP